MAKLEYEVKDYFIRLYENEVEDIILNEESDILALNYVTGWSINDLKISKPDLYDLDDESYSLYTDVENIIWNWKDEIEEKF